MELADAELIRAVLGGETESFEPLVKRYSPRVFAMARRYARQESEAEDIAQEVWAKAFHKLAGYRGEAPFEHWLMRIATHVCYDYLRAQQRRRERTFTEMSRLERDWLEGFVVDPDGADERAEAARALVRRLLGMLSPSARLVLTLLEIEGRSVKEISALTGWSASLVKVRAFRARAQMRKCLQKINWKAYV